tara:strand:- start:157 stop:675 length:519 start_codon:yes stop_codon:yes gene_type:complete
MKKAAPNRSTDEEINSCMPTRNLLIIYHSQSGSTEKMARASLEGASHSEISGIEIRLLEANLATEDDLLWANGIIIGTAEHFGYMSGGLKDFFDRTFYKVEDKIQPLPCAILISAENDGTGALTSIRRIVKGYPFIEVQEPIISRGPLKSDTLEKCVDLGTAISAGLEAGIY